MELIDPSVIHQYVQRAEGLLCLFKKPLHISCLGNIALDGNRFAALLGNLFHYALGSILAGSVVHHHGRPGRAQLLGYARANSLGSPGYDCHFSFKVAHLDLSFARFSQRFDI